MTPPQGALPIERMCALTGVSRASYYRHWRRVAPRREQIELRDVLQRLAVEEPNQDPDNVIEKTVTE